MVETRSSCGKRSAKRSVLQQKKGYSPKNFNFRRIPAEITFHQVNPSGCYKEFCLKDQGILELEVGVNKVISFTPTETGFFEFSCG